MVGSDSGSGMGWQGGGGRMLSAIWAGEERSRVEEQTQWLPCTWWIWTAWACVW